MDTRSVTFCAELREDKEFVLAVVNGLTTARGDKDIVLAAVLKSGRQLQYATAEPEHGQ